jgi:hypothetical protein
VALVATFVSVIRTPGMTELLVSTVVPLISPEGVWADGPAAKSRKSTNRANNPRRIIHYLQKAI